MGDSTKPQFQSSLGKMADMSTKKDRSWANGSLAFGKILKIHYKRHTADVKLLQMSDSVISEDEQEGRHACRISVGYAGVDQEFRLPYGEIIPLQKGMIVLIAFLKNTKEKPVIIKAFHDISEKCGEINYDNILPTQEFENDNPVEQYRSTSINRVQDAKTIDGVGHIEISSHTKTFFVGVDDSINEEKFDYEDLHTKLKRKGETPKTVNVPERKSFPFKWLAVFRDNYNDSETNWLRLVVDATKTAFKLLKQQQTDKKLTSVAIEQDGEFKMRRQLDAMEYDSGSNFVEATITAEGKSEIKRQNAEKVTNVVIEESGDILIERKANKVTTIKINDEGIIVNTDKAVKVTAKENIIVKTDKSLKMTAETQMDLTVGESNIKLSPANITMNSPKINLN